MTTTIEKLHKRLTDALHPAELKIEDDSHRHVGHPGAKQGGHYRVVIVCEAFAGKSLIGRHRMVYEAIIGMMKSEVHAVSIVARTPSEVAASDGGKPA